MIFFKIFNHKLKSHSRKAPGHCFLRFSASGRKVTPGRLQEAIFSNIFSPRLKSQSRKRPGGYFSKVFSHRPKSHSKRLPGSYFLICSAPSGSKPFSLWGLSEKVTQKSSPCDGFCTFDTFWSMYVCSQTYIHTYIHTYMLSNQLLSLRALPNPSPCEGFCISTAT